MATVTSFEELEHPMKSELRQFAELFMPLFEASSEEAKRQAVAALSRSHNVPSAVAFFIASQPLDISASFLSASSCLDDETLIAIARTQGADHARAIVRRDNLSSAVVDALVSLRHSRQPIQMPAQAPVKVEQAVDAQEPADPRLAREESLRATIKQLAAQQNPGASDRLGLRTISTVQEALLVRFARTREADAFATTLADTLSASRWLAERIMLDVSGHQLGTTLKGLGMQPLDGLFILERLYGHLRETVAETTRSAILWTELDEVECGRRVEAWRRADGYTHGEQTAPVRPVAVRG